MLIAPVTVTMTDIMLVLSADAPKSLKTAPHIAACICVIYIAAAIAIPHRTIGAVYLKIADLSQ